MSDRLIIEGKDGLPRFEVEGLVIKDLRPHKHRWNRRGICKTCKISKPEIEESIG